MKNSERRKLRKINYLKRKFQKTLKRIRRKRIKKTKRSHIVKTTYSKLLDFLKEKKFQHKSNYNVNNGIANINIPKKFSFSENPEQTIRVIKNLLYYGLEKSIRGIDFDYLRCELLDLCASTVMDVILLEIEENNKHQRKDFELSGIPPNGKVKDILEVSGILKHLNFPIPDKEYITKLELITSETSRNVSTKVIEYYEKCLNTQSLTLTKKGGEKFAHMVGEIIDNCELHGGSLKKWYASGHYQLNEVRDHGECQLVLFNFGNTIYESLKMPNTSEEILNSLNKFTKKHKKYFNSKWNEESLWTLCALQEGVSRFRHSTRDPDRGNGTINLINSFQTIGNNMNGESPVMSITSGRTHIYFDNNYKMEYVEKNKGKAYVIAFNKDNDLSKPPDPKNVRIIKEYFPGTVISIKFYIDGVYIRKLIRGVQNAD